jgi:hypothetical protein
MVMVPDDAHGSSRLDLMACAMTRRLLKRILLNNMGARELRTSVTSLVETLRWRPSTLDAIEQMRLLKRDADDPDGGYTSVASVASVRALVHLLCTRVQVSGSESESGAGAISGKSASSAHHGTLAARPGPRPLPAAAAAAAAAAAPPTPLGTALAAETTGLSEACAVSSELFVKLVETSGSIDPAEMRNALGSVVSVLSRTSRTTMDRVQSMGLLVRDPTDPTGPFVTVKSVSAANVLSRVICDQSNSLAEACELAEQLHGRLVQTAGGLAQHDLHKLITGIVSSLSVASPSTLGRIETMHLMLRDQDDARGPYTSVPSISAAHVLSRMVCEESRAVSRHNSSAEMVGGGRGRRGGGGEVEIVEAEAGRVPDRTSIVIVPASSRRPPLTGATTTTPPSQSLPQSPPPPLTQMRHPLRQR